MPARELVVTWAAILAATVLLAVVVYGLVAVLPGAVGVAGDAAGAVGSVGSSLADLVTGGDAAGETEGGAANGSDGTETDGDDGADRGSDDGADGDADDTEPSGGDLDVDVDGIGGDDGSDGDDGDATTDAGTNGSTVDDASTETEGTTVSDEPVAHETVNTTTVEQGLVDAINDVRGEAFVSALDTIYEEELWTIADDHADDMVEHGYVGTVAPDGETNADRFDRHDPDCKRVDDYGDAAALAADLNYSTRVDSEWHDDAEGLVERVIERWRDDPAVTDDTYDDMGVAVRHANATDRLYAAAAIC